MCRDFGDAEICHRFCGGHHRRVGSVDKSLDDAYIFLRPLIFFFYFFFAGSGGASGKARRLLQWETSHAMNSCHSSLRVHVVVVLVVAQVTRIRLTEIMLTMGLQASRRPKYNAPKATAAPTRETDRCARASLPSRRRRWRRRVRNRRKERPIKLLALSCVSSNLVPIDQSGASSKSYMQFKFPNFHIWFVQRGKV